MQNTNITARIVGDSINPAGKRLTSFVLTYPRFIHAELMTHRVFSRNAASSRAIPVRKMIEAVETNPAQFVFYGSNKPGMQAGEQLSLHEQETARDIIRDMRECCVNGVHALETLGLHKQNSNRYLEPFGHITVLVTSCDWGNFFALRFQKDAQPEFQQVAGCMAVPWLDSEPELIPWGGWHIPRFRNMSYKMELAETGMEMDIYLKIASARCARLSYLSHDGDHSQEKDLATFDKLVNDPIHASALEHCAQAISSEGYRLSNFDILRTIDDFDGLSHWQQYRKQFAREFNRITKDELRARIANRPDWIKL